jgi:hypothetical protein
MQRHEKRSTSWAREGERLLLTCTSAVSTYVIEDVSQTLHGSMLTDPWWTVLAGGGSEIDELVCKMYRTYQKICEAAPSMFVPI